MEEISDEEECELYKCSDEIFKTRVLESDTKHNYGDLYIAGRLWMSALKSGLLGSTLIPVVRAEIPPPPSKPPPMKYKDLPIYKSPHNEYQEFVEKKTKCPEHNVKLIRQFLLPYVTYCRKEVQENTCKLVGAIKCTMVNIRKAATESKKDFVAMMRDRENMTIRRAVVVAGAGVGYLLGAGKGIPRRLFMTAAGAAAGGALCFPVETDDAFRNFTYYSGKTFLKFINLICGKDFAWRERLPCKDDLPGDKIGSPTKSK